MESIFYIIIAIVAIIIIAKILAWPFKILMGLIVNGIIGAVLLYAINYVGGLLGLAFLIIPINAITALIAGFLGVPGILFLIVLNFIR